MTEFDLERSALVLLDLEEGVAAGAFSQGGPDDRSAFVASLTRLLDTADTLGLPIVRVDVEFREGHPEVSTRNSYFSGAKAAGRLVSGTDATRPMAELADRLATHPRAVKRRIGGFAGSDLPSLLNGLDCDGIIVAGLITRGAVLSTACEAADRDYRVAVLADCSYDPDPEVHSILLGKVLPIRANIIATSDLTIKGGSA